MSKIVLIVDDERDLAATMAQALRIAGYGVVTAGDGLTALETVEAERPDIILLDVMLPDIPGTEVCRRLKRSDSTDWIPIVMVTALGEEVDRDHAETFANAMNGTTPSGELTISTTILWCCGVNQNTKDFKMDDEKDGNGDPITDPFDVEDFFLNKNQGNSVEDPMLTDVFNLSAPDFTPKSGSPAASGADIPGDSFFEKVAFRGGVDPANDWTKGWTTSARN